MHGNQALEGGREVETDPDGGMSVLARTSAQACMEGSWSVSGQCLLCRGEQSVGPDRQIGLPKGHAASQWPRLDK